MITAVDKSSVESLYPKNHFGDHDRRYENFNNDFTHGGFEIAARRGAGGNVFTPTDLIAVLRHSRLAVLQAADASRIHFGPDIGDKRAIVDFINYRPGELPHPKMAAQKFGTR